MHNKFNLLAAVSTVAVIGSFFFQGVVSAQYFPIHQYPVLTEVAPTLTLTTGVTTSFDTTPTVVFESDENGTITYSGDCSSSTTAAVDGSNSITFNALSEGTHSNCEITVTNASDNYSALAIPSFGVKKLAIVPVPILTPIEVCSGFTDLAKSDSDCAAITYVKELGAMTGNPDGSFGPSDLLQRDQIAKIALVTFGKYVNGTNYCGGSNPFPDLDTNAWSYQYICRAKALALVTGYASGADKGMFRASRSVNRSEFLAILLRNLSDNLPTGDSYVDVSAGDWFNSYAKFSKDNSLFSGSAFNAGNLTTRREVAKVIFKLHTLGKI